MCTQLILCKFQKLKNNNAFKKDLVIDFQILHQLDGFVGKHLV